MRYKRIKVFSAATSPFKTPLLDQIILAQIKNLVGEYHLKLEAQTLIKNRNTWHHFPVLFLVLGGKDGGAVRAVASQQCGPDSNPGVNAIWGFWVCCCFSPLFREVFLWVLRLSPVIKHQHFSRNQVPLNHYIFLLIIIFICSSTSDQGSLSTTLSVVPEKRLFEGGARAHFPNSGW